MKREVKENALGAYDWTIRSSHEWTIEIQSGFTTKKRFFVLIYKDGNRRGEIQIGIHDGRRRYVNCVSLSLTHT